MQDSHDVLRDAFEASGPKAVATELGVSLSSVYKWTQASGDGASGATNPLDRLAALIRITGHEPIIQWLCHQAGGFYVKDPNGYGECLDLLPATTEIIQEFASMISIIALAGADGRIAPGEAREVRQRWEELKTVTEGFVCCCEEGHFNRIREVAGRHLAEIEADFCGDES